MNELHERSVSTTFSPTGSARSPSPRSHRLPSHSAALALALAAMTLAACSGGGDTGGGASGLDGGATPARALQEGVTGFWTAGPSSCGGAFDIAYGFALCSTKKVSGVEEVATKSTGRFKWLNEGSFTESGAKVTLQLKRTVVDPSPIRGDVNHATLVLEQKNGTLVVDDAKEMPECKGLVLKKTEGVTDADCEPAGTKSGSGCTADVDCGSCKRCERSTGRCVAKLTC